MEKPVKPQLSGAAVTAAALPPFAFCAVVSSAVPRLTTWAALGSVLTLTPETPFPAAALAACLGAGLVILAGTGGRSLGGRVLGSPPVAFTGLISYSLYLWHWPPLVLAGAYLARPLTVPEGLLVLVATVPVAVASWRWIERPFRGERPGTH